MPQYRIEYVVETSFNAYVEAESESAARQAFIDHDVDYVEMVDGSSHVTAVVEEES